MAKVADLATGQRLHNIAEIFTGRMDFDVGALVGELVSAESVPALPVLCYKPAAMDNARRGRAWNLQRVEDELDSLFEAERLTLMDPNKVEEILRSFVGAIRIDEQAKPQVLREAVNAASYVAEAAKQKLNLTSDAILRPVQDAAKRARKVAVGDIPVPPKYTSADFLSSDCWACEVSWTCRRRPG